VYLQVKTIKMLRFECHRFSSAIHDDILKHFSATMFQDKRLIGNSAVNDVVLDINSRSRGMYSWCCSCI